MNCMANVFTIHQLNINFKQCPAFHKVAYHIYLTYHCLTKSSVHLLSNTFDINHFVCPTLLSWFPGSSPGLFLYGHSAPRSWSHRSCRPAWSGGGPPGTALPHASSLETSTWGWHWVPEIHNIKV